MLRVALPLPTFAWPPCLTPPCLHTTCPCVVLLDSAPPGCCLRCPACSLEPCPACSLPVPTRDAPAPPPPRPCLQTLPILAVLAAVTAAFGSSLPGHLGAVRQKEE